MSHIPVPANQVLPCPFGGNPKVAAQMGIPSCGIARPGPFFADLNKPQGGGKRRKTRKHRGGQDMPSTTHEVVQQDVVSPPENPVEKPVEEPKVVCPTGCVPKPKSRFGLGFFGLGGRKTRRNRRKSRRSRGGSYKKKRKSRRVKSRKHHKKTKRRRAGNDPPGTPSTPPTVQYRPPSPQHHYPSTSASYGFALDNDYGSMAGSFYNPGRGGRR